MKQHNDLLTCGRAHRQRLLTELAHRTVLLCGVTTTSCIAAAVEALKGRCTRVVVARDAVAARAKARHRHDMLLAKWATEEGPGVAVVDSWRQLLPPRFHTIPTAAAAVSSPPAGSATTAAVATTVAALPPPPPPTTTTAAAAAAGGGAAARLMYYVNGSIPSMRVFMALQHCNIDFAARRM